MFPYAFAAEAAEFLNILENSNLAFPSERTDFLIKGPNAIEPHDVLLHWRRKCLDTQIFQPYTNPAPLVIRLSENTRPNASADTIIPFLSCKPENVALNASLINRYLSGLDAGKHRDRNPCVERTTSSLQYLWAKLGSSAFVPIHWKKRRRRR